jgi:DNA primase
LAGPSGPALPGTRASALAGPGAEIRAEALPEAVVLATLALHPGLRAHFLAELETLQTSLPDHALLQRALLSATLDEGTERLPPEAAIAALGPEAGPVLQRILALGAARIAPGLRAASDLAVLREALADDFARIRARRGIRTEIAEALLDADALEDDGITWRMAEAARALERAERAGTGGGGDQSEDRSELLARLQGLIDAEVWVRKRR